MYIVNTSFMVEPSVHDRWLDFIKKQYIPALAARDFRRVVFTRLLSASAEDHFTYSLQVELDDMDRYRQFSEELFPEYTAIATGLFNDKVLWFNSLLKRVDDGE